MNDTPLPLIALSPQELTAAQQSMSEWADRKIDDVTQELADLNAARIQAKQRKWNLTGWGVQIERAEQRLRFYGKVRLALQHGYLVIPDFPVTVFAVRTDATEPPWRGETKDRDHTQNTVRIGGPLEPLPEGEGRYLSPDPKTMRTPKVEKYHPNDPNSATHIQNYFRAVSVREAGLPVTLVQPRLIEATRQAMALRVFDEVGLVGPTNKGDPIVVGRILLRSPGYYAPRRGLNFFIGWWMNWTDF